MSKNDLPPSSRIGAYFWAGPGTIRLLQTKYHSPRIDKDHFLQAYDLPYLQKLKELFGTTDAWITFSWGFSDQTEKKDYHFLRKKLKNFQNLGIRTHAYIQGFNVVTKEFANQDFFCSDHWGNQQSYSKGRSFICPNHPQTRQLIISRIKKALQENVNGIFIDNILFGFPPIKSSSNFTPFFGCACSYCQKKFYQRFDYLLPKHFSKSQLQDYLLFREKSVTKLVKEFSQLVHAKQKEFGINLYDPILRNSRLYFGYSLEKIESYLDYFLIENHSLPSQKRNNNHLLPLIQKTNKPVFVVSYQEGIGFEPQYTQAQINNIFSEAKQINYSLCLKMTEFTSQKTWHCLYLENLQKPNLNKKIFPHFQIKESKKKEFGRISRMFWNTIQPLTIPTASLALNNKVAAKLTRKLHQELVRKI